MVPRSLRFRPRLRKERPPRGVLENFIPSSDPHVATLNVTKANLKKDRSKESRRRCGCFFFGVICFLLGGFSGGHLAIAHLANA